MRTTLAALKASRIPAALGVCATDDRIVPWANEAIHRLLIEGKYFGTYGKYRICSTNNCITLPPQIATIEVAAVCGRWVPVHDLWFEFLEGGAGIRQNSTGCGSCMSEADYRGHYPAFDDLRGVNKKLRWVCDVVGDVGKEALFLGYDENNNWIRTMQGGVLKDGEVIAAAQSPGTTSVNYFSNLTDIQFPVDSAGASAMTGQSWLYEFNTSDSVLRLIGHYQYFETRPAYARYFFPSLAGCGTVTATDCDRKPIDIIGKHEFIPVKYDTDYLIIGNLPALKEMMVAIKNAENEWDGLKKNAVIASGITLAKAILDKELSHYLGDGREMGITLMGSSVGYISSVDNFL